MHVQVNDIALNVEVAGQGRPLLLLHGFTGSAETWNSLVERLAEYHRTIAVDLIGHGASDSPADAERYRMEPCVRDLLAVLDSLGVEQSNVLGYSMGARVALHLAAAAPEHIEKLILESGSPGLADAGERRARVVADEALAADIERDGLEAFVNRWEAIPLFASQAALPENIRAAHRARRLRNNPVGLANSLCGMGTGRQDSLWDRLSTLTVSTMLVAGDLDRNFGEFAVQMAALLPCATVTIVPNAGHAVHLEQPERFNQIVEEFLSEGRQR